MRYKVPALIVLSFTLATAEIFKFPLPNGFPNITSAQALQAVEHQAGGPIPSSLEEESRIGHKFIHFIQAFGTTAT